MEEDTEATAAATEEAMEETTTTPTVREPKISLIPSFLDDLIPIFLYLQKVTAMEEATEATDIDIR